MVKFGIFFFVIFSFHLVFAQEVKEGERKSLFQFTGTIYPVKSLTSSNSYYYLNGHINYFFDDHFSFRGDLWGKKIKNTDDVTKENRVQFSTLYHYSIKRFTTSVGFGTGLGMFNSPLMSSRQFIPSLSLIASEQFHVNDYFYFFVDFQLTFRKEINFNYWNSSIAGSGGLGFQIPCRKLLK